MYPRNAASPQRVSIGPVVQISDGAVQTSGVTVRVLPFGSTEADGGGTTAYSTDGVVVYTPTQAETNYTSFVLIAKKTGCIPATVTVVTSESTVSGRVYVDTNGDKTGYKLASDGLSLVTAWTVAITGNITGNLTGSVGSISGVTFPSNFANLGIDPSGSILLVNTVDELGAGALTANGAGDPIAGIVWNALTTTTYTDQSFGDRILISSNNTREVGVNGNGHVASVLHDAEPNAIPEDALQTGALSARVLATDAVGEIVDAVWDELTSGHTTAGTTGKALIDSGAAGNPWTTDLATGYSGTQAGNILNQVKSNSDLIDNIGINVYPVSASTPERVNGTTITVYKDEQTNVTISTSATLTGLTLRFVAENRAGEDVLVVENAGFAARTATSATLQIPSTLTDEIAVYNWTLRDITTGNSVLARGVLSVQAAASKDA